MEITWFVVFWLWTRDQNCPKHVAHDPEMYNHFCYLYRHKHKLFTAYYNMTVWILAGNYISFTIAAGLIRLHMPGVKNYRV